MVGGARCVTTQTIITGVGTTSTPRVANFSNKHVREAIDEGWWVGEPLSFSALLTRFTSVISCYEVKSSATMVLR